MSKINQLPIPEGVPPARGQNTPVQVPESKAMDVAEDLTAGSTAAQEPTSKEIFTIIKVLGDTKEPHCDASLQPSAPPKSEP